MTQARKLDNVTLDASACIADCRKYGCTGVQVVRATNPAGTLAFPPNIPYIPSAAPPSPAWLLPWLGLARSRCSCMCVLVADWLLLACVFGCCC